MSAATRKRLRAGVVPYFISKQQGPAVLLGKEFIALWSPFAGGVENGEDTKFAAAREFHEEIMGFFSIEEILSRLEGAKSIKVSSPQAITTLYLVPFEYDPMLPIYFSNVLKFILRCAFMRKSGAPIIPGCPEGYLEKSEIAWFWIEEINPLDLMLFSKKQRKVISVLKNYSW